MSNREENSKPNTSIPNYNPENLNLAVTQDERIRNLKSKRGVAKGSLTRLMNQIESLMADNLNASQIAERMKTFEQALEDFGQAHTEYHILLTDETEISESEKYRLDVVKTTNDFKDVAGTWLASQCEDEPHMSASDDGKQSQISATPSVYESRIKATAERIALGRESAVLKEQRDLELKQLEVKQQAEQKKLETERLLLHLEQKRREIELKSKLVRAESLEQSYTEAIVDVVDPTENLFTHSTPRNRENNPTSATPLSTTIHNNATYSGVRHQPKPRLSWGNSTIKPPPGSAETYAAENSLQASVQFGDVLCQMLNETKLHQQSLVEALQLPKTELSYFDGDPLKYWSFIRSFENTVDLDTISDSAKLSRLIQYCTGRAKKLLQCCLVKAPSDGYKLALRLLKERFGNESDISQAWISKITARPRVTNNVSLLDFADDLRCCKETLDTMGYLNEINNSASLLSIIEKLPNYLQTRWLKVNHNIKRTRSPSILDVVNFISSAAEEATDPVFGKIARRTTDRKFEINNKDRRDKSRANFAVQTSSTAESFSTRNTTDTVNPAWSSTCPHCGQKHFITQCPSFRALRIKDRISFVQSKGLCVNCFKPGHSGKNCTRQFVCNIHGCGQKHNRFLHLPKISDGTTESSLSPPGASAQNNTRESTLPPPTNCNFVGAITGKVALPIVPILVRGLGFRNYIETYALLDSGSTQSFCSDELIHHLGIPRKHEVTRLTTLDSKDMCAETFIVDLQISNLDDTHTFDMPHVFSKPKLNIGLTSRVRQDEVNKWPHLKDIAIPDVNISDVHVLIGQDMPDALIPREVRSGQQGEPYATKTLLGWTLNGPIESKGQSTPLTYFVKNDSDLQTQVERFWKIDDLKEDTNAFSVSDKKVISVWEDSLEILNGHYSMNIPFKIRPPHLPNNLSVAEHRLRLLGRRLDNNPSMKEKYTSGITDLLVKKYAEIVPPEQLDRNDGYVWYLPHHPVIHPRKPDKPRIVFDCSSKFRNISLNDKVLQGPDLTNKLIGVLLRFRQEHIALMADVEGMFHQVRVNEPDRDVLRFLWWKDNDTSMEPVTYRMTAHLFGGIWSPSCANFALKQCAEDNSRDFDSSTISTVDKNFYVDDCLKSVSNVKEAISLAHSLRNILQRGGFRLTKWISNSREVLQSIPDTEHAKTIPSLELDDNRLPVERALGVLWKVETDSFGFNTSLPEKPHTKRGVLSLVSSVYDPLGFVSPFILKAKIMFQTMCRMKCNWDDPIPDVLAKQWNRWLQDLPSIENFTLSRCIKPRGFDVVTAQLHHFADASEQGYGAVSYLRLTDVDGNVYCAFIMSKSKLAPLKPMTIPRLELAAAVETVRLDKIIRKELEIPLVESAYWSDSMIVLWYLRNEEKRFQTYVANRVATIRDHASPDQWKHVKSEDNPADHASRGLAAVDLISKSQWLHGPQYLWQREDTWPSQPNFEVDIDTKAELKNEPQVYAVTTQIDIINTFFKRYSSWFKLKKAVAWILRLKSILHKKKNDFPKTLTVTETQAAELAIVTYLQRTNFTEAVIKEKNLRKLCPYYNEQGVLCVGGRLSNADLTTEAKHQKILPPGHVTRLIIEHYHALSAHAGVERVLADIRQHYWILRGRVNVKGILSRCLPCKKLKALPESQFMSDLPKDRVTAGEAPFTRTGVDYFGPFLVKRGRSELKRYGCLFTCLTTRSIHIEVSHTLDTDSFLNALQRFIARRGEPQEIRSDNGTNFVGCQAELSKSIKLWNSDKIHNFMLKKEIKWIFNTPAASHMGGVWERQIRTVRSVLKGLLNQQPLDDEGLATLMCIVEGIVNSRPITKLSDDPRDSEPLTPNHLLLLRSGPTIPSGIFVKQDLYQRRWRQVQYLADIFWHRWLREYLPALQARQKWFVPKRNLKEGDLVLIKDDKTPRYQWPLGLIVNTYPGKDGFVRSVKVKTQIGVYDRPVDKICFLEGQVTSNHVDDTSVDLQ